MRGFYILIWVFLAAMSVSLADDPGDTLKDCVADGKILRQVYTGLSGSLISSLSNYANYPDRPDFEQFLNSFEGPQNEDDSYGARYSGYICAPQTGDYIFYISADDRAELWLSTDTSQSNVTKIASVPDPTSFRAYFTYPSQKSELISLKKGKLYFVQAMHKEGTKSDHLTVAWTMPDKKTESPIPGGRLLSVNASRLVTSTHFQESNIPDVKMMEVSPIPARSNIHATFYSSENENALISITDIFSEKIQEISVQITFGNNVVNIPLTGIAPGIYFLNIVSNHCKMSQRIVINGNN